MCEEGHGLELLVVDPNSRDRLGGWSPHTTGCGYSDGVAFIGHIGLRATHTRVIRGEALEDAVDISSTANDLAAKYAISWLVRVFLLCWILLGVYWWFGFNGLRWPIAAAAIIIVGVWAKGLRDVRRAHRLRRFGE
jgi:hypothetical protein